VVPPVYPGSSQLSRVAVAPVNVSPTTYGVKDTNNPDGNFDSSQRDKMRFPSYAGATLYFVHTQLAVDVGGSREDSLPPNMFQVGDIIEADGNRFVIVDDSRNQTFQKVPYGARYLNPGEHLQEMEDTLICVRLDEVLQGNKVPPLAVPPNGYSYGIHRQPMGAERTSGSPSERVITSGEAPLQLPAGVAIDLLASGIEANEMKIIYPAVRPSYTDLSGTTIVIPHTVGILFSPNGGIDSFWLNGERTLDISRVFFLLGRVENGNPDDDLFTNWDRSGGGTTQQLSDNDFRDRISKVNWLNPDSRWLTINANDGRLSVSQNANVDPRIDDKDTDHDDEMRSTVPLEAMRAQIEAAHELAHGGHGEEQ
jgi:hypothetical protein